ncbi:MAG: DUF3592 domain-containing protein [Burkholderiales bacterium]
MMLLVGGVFIMIGLIFIPVAIRKIRADVAARRWPAVEAVLRSAEVVKHVRERPREEHPGLTVSYACVLHYEYTVEGRTYPAQHGEGDGTVERAAQLAAAHAPGETRTIQVEPGAPANHRVDPDSSFSGLLWLLPCAGFAGFGALIIVVGLP